MLTAGHPGGAWRAGASLRHLPEGILTSRLLLIDDDARLSAMVGDYLRHAGFEVTTAASAVASRTCSPSRTTACDTNG